jgi:hypothetical protein
VYNVSKFRIINVTSEYIFWNSEGLLSIEVILSKKFQIKPGLQLKYGQLMFLIFQANRI